MPQGFTIGLARAEELERLPDIERAAATLFAGFELPLEPLQTVSSLDELAAAQRERRLWVARGESGEPIGFAQVEWVGGEPHLEEMNVLPSHGRRGVGRALVEAVLAWARSGGHLAVTLTTFRDLPWNAPFYARCGFRALEPAELSTDLHAVVDDEAARGLDPATRVVMRCDLREPGSGWR
jgi:GNAT superfamily N-acetyltransferase